MHFPLTFSDCECHRLLCLPRLQHLYCGGPRGAVPLWQGDLLHTCRLGILNLVRPLHVFVLFMILHHIL